MSEILLCNRPTTAESLQANCGIDPSFVHGKHCSKPDILSAFTPYALGEAPTNFDNHVTSQLSNPTVAKELTNHALSFGSDNTLALAEFTSKFQELNVGLMGASTSVYANRIGGFAGAVKDYQDTLMAYRDAVKSNGATKAAAKNKAFKAFQKLQTKFGHELKVINSGNKARRGTSLSSATRATNIARSSRGIAKLDVVSQAQAHNLVKFTKHAKVLGNGLAMIDFGSRIGSVHNSYQAGGNWERDLFIESTSFAAGAYTGLVAANIGAAAIGFLLVATPIGWVGLIVGGVAVAGAVAGSSMAMNNLVKNSSGSWYDSIMNALRF